MVTAPDSSSDHHSLTSAPPLPVVSGDSNSPKFPPKTLASPWAQVVRGGGGGDGESTAPVPQSPRLPPPSSSSSSSSSSIGPDQVMLSDSVQNSNSNVVAADGDSNEGNVGVYKKSVWKKPSNGVVVEASPVMGDESWPALSESTKVSGKLQPDSSSSKVAAEGTSLSSSQALVTSHSPQKQASTNAKPNSATNYNMPNRQKSMKRGGDSNIVSGPALSSFSNPSPPSLSPRLPLYQVQPGGYGIPDHSPRDHYRNYNWDTRPPAGGFVPTMNEHHGSSRRGNFGPPLRGDGSYHNNYGSRRDQDSRNYANTRDTHIHQPRMPHPRGILTQQQPPNRAAFVAPQLIGGPYLSPFDFPQYPYFPNPLLDHFQGMPFFTHGPPPAMFFPAEESSLTKMIVNQIDYYFSEANLVKDDFLKSFMDEQGWVPVTLIADFPRVKSLTDNIQLILDSMKTSTVVEVKDDKLRRHLEWKKWVPSAKLQADSGSVSPSGSRSNNVVVDFQTMTLNEEATTKEEGPTESSNHS